MLCGRQAHAAAVGGYLRSSQVIGRSLELQLACEQKARSQAEAEAQGRGAQRVRCDLSPPDVCQWEGSLCPGFDAADFDAAVPWTCCISRHQQFVPLEPVYILEVGVYRNVSRCTH